MQQVIGLLAMGGADLINAMAEKAADNPNIEISLPVAMPAPSVEAPLAGQITLGDHLRGQLPFLLAQAGDAAIAEALIAALDDRGFVALPLAQIAKECRTTQGRVETVLSALHRAEPTGVFARSLPECLALQLRERGQMSPEMDLLLQKLELIADGRLAELAAHCGTSRQALTVMMSQIRDLNPRPNAGFFHQPMRLRLPDLILSREANGWAATLNPDAQPKIHLRAINMDAGQGDARGQHREARQLQRALAMRNRTLMALGQFLAVHQQDFLTHGARCLRPLTRRMAAHAVGVHESTISRIVANCAVQTPSGIMTLRAFFSGPAGNAEAEGPLSAHAVETQIAGRICAEDPARPYSDTSLAAWLGAQGVQVSRRTVGNYRTRAGYPDKASRRRLAETRALGQPGKADLRAR